MHQVSLETICPLKASWHHYCPDNNAKSILKHFDFLQKFSVLTSFKQDQPQGFIALCQEVAEKTR